MNAPKLRFKEFNDEWKKAQISSFVNINPKNDSLPEKFVYIDLESVNNGLLTSRKVINKSEAPSRAQRTIVKNDILYQTVRPYQMNNLFINRLDSDYPYIASTGYALLRTEENPYFVYSILYQKAFVNKVLNMCTGTSYPAISANDLGTIFVCLPSIREQEKISRTLELLDKKIELQSKKIEDLKLFKKGLSTTIFNSLRDFKEYKLGKICNITTGKLDANAMIDNGKYRFYTCAKEYSLIDKYAFDTEALLISGNGAYVGYIHYYKGKFNAYQRTYVLDNFSQNIQFIKCYLEENLAKRINSEKKEGNTPYIVLSTLSDMVIKIPSKENQIKISNIINCHNKKIELEENKLLKLQELKKGLMQSMFV